MSLKIIVGLGNPGSRYEGSRHNVGSVVLDRMARRYAPGAVARGKFHGALVEGAVNSRRVLLLKPTTYMNASGQSVAEAVRFYRLEPSADLLVIVDDTAEWDRAVYYASRWAIRVGGGVLMLRVIETEDQNQQWLGVADIMRAEAEEAANEALDRAAGRANGIAAITPERVIREGDPTEQILDVIDKDVDIAMLVLAANPGAEGPGPIITTMAKTMGAFPIPVTIVPGGLTDAEIDALS